MLGQLSFHGGVCCVYGINECAYDHPTALPVLICLVRRIRRLVAMRDSSRCVVNPRPKTTLAGWLALPITLCIQVDSLRSFCPDTTRYHVVPD